MIPQNRKPRSNDRQAKQKKMRRAARKQKTGRTTDHVFLMPALRAVFAGGWPETSA